MLEVKGIDNGIVLDHITAGNGIKVFNKLFSEQTDYPVVLVLNVESGILGRKDIIKIENKFDVDLDALGLIDENITVNIIRDGKRIDKQKVSIPEKKLQVCLNAKTQDVLQTTIATVNLLLILYQKKWRIRIRM